MNDEAMFENVTVLTFCPKCNGTNEVRFSLDSYRRWNQGALIQEAIPELNADEREMLMTGICPGCWDKMFPEDDE